jgi:hypothetical protein
MSGVNRQQLVRRADAASRAPVVTAGERGEGPVEIVGLLESPKPLTMGRAHPNPSREDGLGRAWSRKRRRLDALGCACSRPRITVSPVDFGCDSVHFRADSLNRHADSLNLHDADLNFHCDSMKFACSRLELSRFNVDA